MIWRDEQRAWIAQSAKCDVNRGQCAKAIDTAASDPAHKIRAIQRDFGIATLRGFDLTRAIWRLNLSTCQEAGDIIGLAKTGIAGDALFEIRRGAERRARPIKHHPNDGGRSLG